MTQGKMWSPVDNGLSVSGLNLWLQDRFAFDVSYLRGYEVVEKWNHNLAYGNLMQAGMEGWIKTQQKKGMLRFIQQEYKKQVAQHGTIPQIQWWTKLACHQCGLFVDKYNKDPHLPLSAVTTSERNVRVEVPLPSGRTITLNGYIDGEGPGLMMENKVRGRWNAESIKRQIKYDLQYNYYLIAIYNETGTLPKKVWYQHSLRIGSFGYRGPRQKKQENDDEYLARVKEHMDENTDNYFYRYIGRPTLTDIKKFSHACLYPMLEAFLDWYQYKVDERLGITEPGDNHYDWMTPYGLYNPFTEEVPEKFRNLRLTGNLVGLRKKQF